MRILVVGAGASIEEARRANAPEEFWPPTVKNFAKKMWNSSHNQFFNYWLPEYLSEQGIDPGNDPTTVFTELTGDSESVINIERLFEYCWVNKGKKFEGDWENLIYHGLINPLNFLLLMSFYKNGAGINQLEAGKLVSGRLDDGDMVLNLNYDTLFEIAAIQGGRQITYVPNEFKGEGLLIAKPHGSLNLLADEKTFWFANPNCIGALPSSADNFRNHRAIVPPRFNKTYAQHDIARTIFEGIVNLRPDTMTFWGVGLTDSDVDLVGIYKAWVASACALEVIDIDAAVAGKAKKIFGAGVQYFPSIEEWLE